MPLYDARSTEAMELLCHNSQKIKALFYQDETVRSNFTQNVE
ncbi:MULTISPECIES: hypothetical protein [unclassified Vibrio]|uniref:Uncharacterized protein n=1 Tax=Vibrio sp. HB236076 TaxID=3232307 RepID=A0AB39HES4_9VIBR|nr:hypothetical protein [Vibrio sp. HB161653]MDP5252706.1 hypothetical protein [Vibrio sp. HB161653]